MQLVGSVHRAVLETVGLAVLREAAAGYGVAFDDMALDLEPGDGGSVGFRFAGTILKAWGLARVHVEVAGRVALSVAGVLWVSGVTTRAALGGVLGWPAG